MCVREPHATLRIMDSREVSPGALDRQRYNFQAKGSGVASWGVRAAKMAKWSRPRGTRWLSTRLHLPCVRR